MDETSHHNEDNYKVYQQSFELNSRLCLLQIKVLIKKFKLIGCISMPEPWYRIEFMQFTYKQLWLAVVYTPSHNQFMNQHHTLYPWMQWGYTKYSFYYLTMCLINPFIIVFLKYSNKNKDKIIAVSYLMV